ncbi:DJ-1/PfpI family protein [Streptomyces sp. SID3343]|uniref:DJ-1/PfpI family protein n=1 Tax=Streptomyces sp. SID3343 TaxID=2690260 RepID=UPI00136AA03C|nr:helix-turn-helix domain-containing protein [Streptomyces sp. SID3343]
MSERAVVFVIFDGFQPLDLVGPHEVFSHAGGYRCTIVARHAGLVRSHSALPVHAGFGIADVDPADVDTLVVVGGGGVDAACHDAELVAWIVRAAAAARRVTSVCSGVFLLGAAGLIHGRRVTTHWRRAAQLEREHPEAIVDVDPIFVRDGTLWTSAGVSSGMDLALALVEEDAGRSVAHDVARELVLFLRRPGGQSQFGVPLWGTRPVGDPLRAVIAAVVADPGARHTIADLAGCAGLSPRHFQRRFTAELGVGPAAYVERVRVEAASRALAEGGDPVEAIARRCGFGTGETLRRTFHRHLGVAPSDYRDRFRTSVR